MKKVIAIALALILICAAAYAAIDLSGMSFDELLELRKQVDAALWASDGWQEVTVPQGVYRVGEDIPAGRWCVTPAGNWGTFEIYEADHESYVAGYVVDGSEIVNVTLEDGQWVEISDSAYTFRPYTGAALGFK